MGLELPFFIKRRIGSYIVVDFPNLYGDNVLFLQKDLVVSKKSLYFAFD